jgi:nucleotide-binding universal stress UspA family protein
MYKKMLVPMDGTQLSETAIPYVKDLSRRLGLDIIIFHVCSQKERGLTAMHQAYVDRIAEIMRRQAIKFQQVNGFQSRGMGIIAKGKLTVGYPAEQINNYVDEYGVDFILMATHGYSGIKRLTNGSVADKVIQVSKVPVLLVRDGIPDEISYDKWPQKTLVVLLDGSKLAESVLPHVKALAKQRGTEPVDIVLLRVCDRSSISSSYSKTSMTVGRKEHVKQAMTLLKQEGEQYLTGVGQQLKDTGLMVKSKILIGDPVKNIINYTNRHPYSLIVMATHGRSGLIRWALGSVADRILSEGSSPIFLVRPHKPKNGSNQTAN